MEKMQDLAVKLLLIQRVYLTQINHVHRQILQKQVTISHSSDAIMIKGMVEENYQKGGNMAMNAANEAKGFTDSTKYGFPYSLAENENPIISDFGQYFITYFSFVRSIGVKANGTIK